MKGPISLPLQYVRFHDEPNGLFRCGNQRELGDAYLGLITPKTLAASSIQKLFDEAKTRPLPVIKQHPMIRTLRRPRPSATRVKRKLRATSPNRVNVINKPIRASVIPSPDRKSAKTNVVPPYAKRRVNRCRQRSLVSRGDWMKEKRPSSEPSRDSNEDIRTVNGLKGLSRFCRQLCSLPFPKDWRG